MQTRRQADREQKRALRMLIVQKSKIQATNADNKNRINPKAKQSANQKTRFKLEMTQGVRKQMHINMMRRQNQETDNH